MNPTEYLLDQMRNLEKQVVQQSERQWVATSAEMALAWLRMNLYFPATVADEVCTEDGCNVHLMQRAFFRGQSDARWPPKPTLFRKSAGSERARAERALKLATDVIDVEFKTLWHAHPAQGWPPLPEKSSLAAAQHYGIATPLLDWTTNPTVAVHFATCSTASNHDGKASVLWLAAEDAVTLGLKIILPPPTIERLYHQRGVFTELAEQDVKKLSDRVGCICFPAQPPHPARTVDAQGARVGDFAPEPHVPWFDLLAGWVWGRANDPASANIDPMHASLEFTSQFGHIPALNSADGATPFLSDGVYFGVAKRFVEELAGRATRNGTLLDPRIMNVLWRDNAGLLGWLGLDPQVAR